jgi:hypothetical protein
MFRLRIAIDNPAVVLNDLEVPVHKAAVMSDARIAPEFILPRWDRSWLLVTCLFVPGVCLLDRPDSLPFYTKIKTNPEPGDDERNIGINGGCKP